jgi:hypothetical protein
MRQFEEGFSKCVNTDQDDTAAAIFAKMAARRLELAQLIEGCERLQAER